MDSTFIRKDFYLAPPAKNATAEEWQAWQRKDDLKARGAKSAFTRAQKAEECQDERLNRQGMVKLGGVWRQSVALYSGSSEDGTLEREVGVNAKQEWDFIRMRQDVERVHQRGGTRKNRNRVKRAKIRNRRKAKYQ